MLAEKHICSLFEWGELGTHRIAAFTGARRGKSAFQGKRRRSIVEKKPRR
jgi:hypothetical protein